MPSGVDLVAPGNVVAIRLIRRNIRFKTLMVYADGAIVHEWNNTFMAL